MNLTTGRLRSLSIENRSVPKSSINHVPLLSKSRRKRTTISSLSDDHVARRHTLSTPLSGLSHNPQVSTDEQLGSQPLQEPSRRQLLVGAAAVSSFAAIQEAVLPQRGRAPASQDGRSSWTERVSEFTLSNGLTFIVMERHNAPVVSCSTYANVGAFDEEDGRTGLAHLLEHMAFKGTSRIGTTNARLEAGLLDSLDELFYEQLEQDSIGDTFRRDALAVKMAEVQLQAEALAVPNAFGRLLQRAGGIGLNAGTSQDSTRYYVSLPANRLELWFAAEAERFQAPVFRQLYSEKRVVEEERRLRVTGSPMGAFQESFQNAAFANNYSRPIIGWPDDFARLGRREVAEFHRQHYGPRALTISIVGDVDPSQVRTFAEKYFGSWRDADSAAPATMASAGKATAAPGPSVRREFEMSSLAGPAALHAFYRPGMNSPEALPLEVVSTLLSGTRTSRLYRNLVQPGRAVSASCVPAYPGEKHPGAMLLYGNAGSGGSLDTLSEDLLREARRLGESLPDPAELSSVKKGYRVTLLEALSSNSNMAATLGSYRALTGDWRRVLQDLDTVDALTGEDVRSAAANVFVDSNMFTGRMTALKMPSLTMELNMPDMLQQG